MPAATFSATDMYDRSAPPRSQPRLAGGRPEAVIGDQSRRSGGGVIFSPNRL
jgi:hypothetical protein